ncbi:cellulose binding domain-containing protein [Plantactinospora sp. S1510]|uniref:Cellulose binding domain-containing protein n=1 Tax=Plantactinospora alkalitolerans TaxID=2789879 RepID=A0ABS0GPU3_9ACTN|nr:cellulose binding domain-containing protein [Plantactinospora alkalitolerans]MBF9128225.1 cellulose binding domain-containing protein [Plantactinospora alkalitolerans]
MLRHRLAAGAIAGAAALVLALGGATLAAGVGPVAYAENVAPLAATAGCGQAPALTSGTRTIQSGGQNRSFILRIPDNYDRNHPYRLIFGFHWNGGTANDVDSGGTSGYPWSYYGIRALSNNSAIFVAPQGIGNGWANSGDRDLTFVDDMMRQIEAGLCVDTTQRFAMGFSYGGGMSYAIACARASVFRAVAVYAGGQLSGCNGGTQPIAYIGIHGLRDNVLPISTGRSLRDRFVRNNGCTAQNPPEPAQGSLTHTVTYYSGCRAGYPVAWAPFDGPHAPNAVDGTADAYAPGERSWTRPVVWSFFTQFDGTTPTTPPVNPTTPPVNPTTPPVNPTTPPVNPTTPPQGGGGCTATVSLNSWTGGFVATVRVTAGSSGTNGWTVSMTLPGGASVTNTWSASSSGSTGTVRFSNVSYNGRLTSGQVTEFGFQGNGSGSGMTPTCTAS